MTNQPVLYFFNNHYYINSFPQECYQNIENKNTYPIINNNPPKITVYPKSCNIVINPIKKEQVFNSKRDIRLPGNYKDLSYDSQYN